MYTILQAWKIRFKPIEIKDVEIAVWSDASFANTIDRKSQGGYLIAAVDRKSKIQQVVSSFSMALEEFPTGKTGVINLRS